MTFNKYSKFFWLLGVLIMYNIAYDGILLKSIHYNSSKININVDGTEAIVIGILALIAGIYLLYLTLELFTGKDKNEKTDDNT